MVRIAILIVTHFIIFGLGFAVGVYTLPILTAAPAVDEAVLVESAQNAQYDGEFVRGQRGNDFVHWGEGSISVSSTQIVHQGKLSPGPDYKLYLVKEFVEHEDEFLPIKGRSVQIAEIKGFNGFIVDIPAGVNIDDYNTVLIWCESFSEFITSAQYRP